jgi:hypothetical protein
MILMASAPQRPLQQKVRDRKEMSPGLNCSELFWQRPIDSSPNTRKERALLPCAFICIETKVARGTSISSAIIGQSTWSPSRPLVS